MTYAPRVADSAPRVCEFLFSVRLIEGSTRSDFPQATTASRAAPSTDSARPPAGGRNRTSIRLCGEARSSRVVFLIAHVLQAYTRLLTALPDNTIAIRRQKSVSLAGLRSRNSCVLLLGAT